MEQSGAQANPRPKQKFFVITALTFLGLVELRFRISYPDTALAKMNNPKFVEKIIYRCALAQVSIRK